MIRYYVTDRRSLPAGKTLLASIARNLQTGADWIQVREKDLSAKALFDLVTRALALPNPRAVKFLVNTRVDVALAAGAAGAHLPSDSPSPAQWRAIVPAGFLFGVSCHSIADVQRAEQDGADYALFGPVFSPISKTSALPPVGLSGLREAVQSVRFPVLALGGITEENAPSLRDAGASGIAGISLFQSPHS
jgi:thiamine-phosphate pyrophosphorylase